MKQSEAKLYSLCSVFLDTNGLIFLSGKHIDRPETTIYDDIFTES